jgi:hypothetical protein
MTTALHPAKPDAAAALARKLGYRTGMRTRIIDLPPVLAVQLPRESMLRGHADWTLVFFDSAASVARDAPRALAAYQRGGHLWCAYRKKSAKRRGAGDLTRDHGWAPLLQAGLLPVTQVSLDDTWSALRFRYRDEIRSLTRKSADSPP